jgi:hypothetical protein
VRPILGRERVVRYPGKKREVVRRDKGIQPLKAIFDIGNDRKALYTHQNPPHVIL